MLRTAQVDVFPHPSKEEARIFFYDAQARVVKDEGDEKPIVDYVGSDDSEDRYGSIIDPRGWETDAYMRSGSGPVLWAHQYDVPPVGKTIRLTKNSKALLFRVEFAVTQSEFAREIWNLVRDGYLPGVSVGFIPKAAEEYEADTVNSYFAENKRYTAAELLELSVVPVPANRNALKKAYADGKISDKTVELAHLRGFLQDGPLYLSRATMATRSEVPTEQPKQEQPKNEPPAETPKVEEPKAPEPKKELAAIGEMRDWVYVNEQEELEIDEAEREREMTTMNALAESYIRQVEIGINGWIESKHGALRGVCRSTVMNAMWMYDDIRSYMKAWYGQSPDAALAEDTERAVTEVFAEERASLSAKRAVDDIAELRKGAKLSKKNKEDLLKALEILQNLDGLNESADEDEEQQEQEQTDDTNDSTMDTSSTELVGAGTNSGAGETRNVAEIALFLRNGLKMDSSNGGGVTEETRSTDTTTGEKDGSGPPSPPKRSSYLDLIIARK